MGRRRGWVAPLRCKPMHIVCRLIKLLKFFGRRCAVSTCGDATAPGISLQRRPPCTPCSIQAPDASRQCAASFELALCLHPTGWGDDGAGADPLSDDDVNDYMPLPDADEPGAQHAEPASSHLHDLKNNPCAQPHAWQLAFSAGCGNADTSGWLGCSGGMGHRRGRDPGACDPDV